jgi:hypothetical protein
MNEFAFILTAFFLAILFVLIVDKLIDELRRWLKF